MAISDDKTRASVTVANDVYEWYRKEADVKGVTISAMMAIALSHYMDQTVGMRVIGTAKDVKEVMRKLEDLQFNLQKSLLDK